MDSFAHPVPKFPWLPILLNFFWPGLGIAVDSLYGPSGIDIKVLVLGIVVSWLYVIAWCLFYFIIPFFLAILIWAFGLYYGYIVYNKSK